MFWLNLPLEYLGAAAALAVLLLVAGLVQHRHEQQQTLHEVRQLVLGRLSLAARRGLPLPAALNALAEDLRQETAPPAGSKLLRGFAWLFKGPLLRRRIERVSDQVSEVATLLSEGGLRPGLEAARQSFPAPLPQVLERAEAEGQLLVVLTQLARDDRRERDAQAGVRARLTYPTWVLASALVPVLTIHPEMTRIIDRVLANAGGGPPPLAQGWLPVSHAALAVLTPLVVLALWSSTWLIAPRGDRWRELGERLPWFRTLHQAAARVRFANLLQASLRAGLPLADALNAGAELSHDPERVRQAAVRVADGEALVPALREVGLVEARQVGTLPARRGAELAALEQLGARARAQHAGMLDRLTQVSFPVALVLVASLAATSYWLPMAQLREIQRGFLW